MLDREIDWFVLRNTEYVKLAAMNGIYKSEAFPGLWLDAAALLRQDYARVREVLNAGLESEEHRRFLGAKSDAQGPTEREIVDD